MRARQHNGIGTPYSRVGDGSSTALLLSSYSTIKYVIIPKL